MIFKGLGLRMSNNMGRAKLHEICKFLKKINDFQSLGLSMGSNVGRAKLHEIYKFFGKRNDFQRFRPAHGQEHE